MAKYGRILDYEFQRIWNILGSESSGQSPTMNIERVASWLQLTANLGIIGGLVLVGFQLHQNSEILKAQMMNAESRSVIDQELQIVGEEGATAWVAAMSDPRNVSPEHHRIMEAIFWSAIESWRHTEELGNLDLVDIDPHSRVTDEAAWYFGNTYGRAWWTVQKDGIRISDELKNVIDEAISKHPDFTADLNEQLIEEILRISEVE